MPADNFTFGHVHTPSFTSDNIHSFEFATSNDMRAYVGSHNIVSRYAYPTSDNAAIGFPEASPISSEPHTHDDHGDGNGGQHNYSHLNMAG